MSINISRSSQLYTRLEAKAKSVLLKLLYLNKRLFRLLVCLFICTKIYKIYKTVIVCFIFQHCIGFWGHNMLWKSLTVWYFTSHCALLSRLVCFCKIKQNWLIRDRDKHLNTLTYGPFVKLFELLSPPCTLTQNRNTLPFSTQDCNGKTRRGGEGDTEHNNKILL